MLKVLIADDENYVIKSLITTIPWAQFEMEVAGTANDAAEAFKLVSRLSIDIVITDIQMPGFNGLELCRQLHELSPNIQIIIISGYADFAYAQKALQYGVLGYCLKPIETSDITAFLKKARLHHQKQYDLKHDDLLDSIQEGNISMVESLLKDYHLPVGRFYIGASIGTANLCQILKHCTSVRFGKDKYYYLSADPIEEDLLSKALGQRAGCGIGLLTRPSASGLIRTDMEAVKIMAYQFFIKGQSYTCNTASSSDAKTLASINKFLVQKDTGLLLRLIGELRTEPDVNIKTALKMYNFIYTHIMIPAGEQENTDNYIYNFDQLVSEFQSFQSMLQSLEALLSPGCPNMFANTESANHNFLKIMKYINKNYSSDISLKSIADNFYLNPSYVSQLFKKETGTTYSKYLVQLRIEKAKELLQNSGLSISEISEATGFNDYFYFLKTFKKMVGVSPGKYIPFHTFR